MPVMPGYNFVDKVMRLKSIAGSGALLIIAILLLSSCETVPKVDRSSMTIGFAEAAFGLGSKTKANHAIIASSTITRWDDELPVYLIVKGEPEGSKLYLQILAQMQEVFSLAGIELIPATEPGQQTLTVYIKDEALLTAGSVQTPCYFHQREVTRGYVTRADIYLSRVFVSSSEESCVAHEAMHALGFGGHPHRLNSVLSYTENLRKLTPFDRELVEILYSDSLDSGTDVSDAVTTVYSELTRFPETTKKRYVPVDISLQINIDESPLVFVDPFMKSSTKRFYYQTEKNGQSTITISYDNSRADKRIAYARHTRLSGDHIITKHWKAAKLAQSYETLIGKSEVLTQGYGSHPIGKFEFVITRSQKYSCVFTIKYTNVGENDFGGHQMIYGYLCDGEGWAFDEQDARVFIAKIQILDRDPLKIRERKLARTESSDRDYSLLRLSGRWPLDQFHVSGLKMISKGDPSGVIKIRINDEVCLGKISKLDVRNEGAWELDCDKQEDSSGNYVWSEDGSFAFSGETRQSGLAIDWRGDQVF